jgi:hypothetical protein
MILNIQLTEQDYVDAALSTAMPSSRYITVTLVLLVSAFVVAGIVATQGYAREAIVGVGCLVGCLVGIIVEKRLTIPRKARRVFHQQHLNKPFELEWNDEGISVVAPDGSFSKPWSAIWKARLLEKEILLFLSEASFLMVPKRSFPDAITLGAFETLLGRVTKFG